MIRLNEGLLISEAEQKWLLEQIRLNSIISTKVLGNGVYEHHVRLNQVPAVKPEAHNLKVELSPTIKEMLGW